MVNNAIPYPELDWETIQEDGYKIYRVGSHQEGNFIQVYAPDSPCVKPGEKLKLITYLHGFALCIPKFYRCHLIELVKEGYYVVFPDFQKSDYQKPDYRNIEQLQAAEVMTEKPHLSFWVSQLFKLIKDTVLNRDDLPVEAFLSDEEIGFEELSVVKSRRTRYGRFQYGRFLLSVILIIGVIKVFLFWFNRTYGKNLIHLISTVAWSLLDKPEDWIHRSINLTKRACKELNLENFEFYLFGHSVGGLLALSWPAFVDEQEFYPQEIIVADPAPNTEIGIPKFAMFILKLFRSPFATAPMTIRETGNKLTIPVGILHGADDTLVKPDAWIKPALFQSKSNFDFIVSSRKRIYFSLSDEKKNLIAFHNQAVTDTTYYSPALFKHFGGVKNKPNDYNFQYIWLGLDAVIKQKNSAEDLLPLFENQDIKVVTDRPPQPSIWSTVIKIFGFVAVLALGSWLWNSVLFN
ncbi:MAG TPA: hypothetical protein VK203_10645 [Nostocaceae cyanobacterium]|nr:hypothetical protein [Nostocaceae cyanobacterium]